MPSGSLSATEGESVGEPQAKEGRQITQIKNPFKNKTKSIIEYAVLGIGIRLG